MDKTFRYKKIIEETLGRTVEYYTEGENIASFEVENFSVTFETLSLLSKALKTKIINLDTPEGRSSSGCETCGNGAYTMTSVYIKDIKLKV